MPPRQRKRLLLNTLGLLCAILMCVQSLQAADKFNVDSSKVPNIDALSRLSLDKPLLTLSMDDVFTLTLDDRQIRSFTISQKTVNADDSISLTGADDRGAKLLLTVAGDAVYGSIQGVGLNYSISTDPSLGLIIINQAHATFPEIDLEHDALIPPNKSDKLSGIEQMSKAQKQALNQVRNSTNSESTITMLFVYSAEFAGGFSSPTARINDLLNFTNQSMRDSGVNLQFTLAGAQQLNFDNSLSTGTTLNQVTNGLGAFSGVAALRNQVGADMVAVLSFADGFSSNGIAWVNGDNPNFAFSSTRLSPRCCNSVFAHELGHNLGSGHERASVNSNAGDPCSNFNFTGYSCGHGNASRNWGTIMSRLNSNIVGNVFSNPLSTDCRGEPCGIAEGQAGAADNVRSFNISRLLVANFRDDPAPVDPPTPPFTGGPSDPENPDAAVLVPVIDLLLDSP